MAGRAGDHRALQWSHWPPVGCATAEQRCLGRRAGGAAHQGDQGSGPMGALPGARPRSRGGQELPATPMPAEGLRAREPGPWMEDGNAPNAAADEPHSGEASPHGAGPGGRLPSTKHYILLGGPSRHTTQSPEVWGSSLRSPPPGHGDTGLDGGCPARTGKSTFLLRDWPWSAQGLVGGPQAPGEHPGGRPGSAGPGCGVCRGQSPGKSWGGPGQSRRGSQGRRQAGSGRRGWFEGTGN